MIVIYPGEQIAAANAHRPSVEVFASETERVVVEDAADYSSQGLPAWVADIISARSAPHVPSVPEAVTMRQARLALLGFRLPNGMTALAAINEAVAVAPGDAGEAARIEWEFASEVRRDSPTMGAIASAVGLTSEQLDQLFITAAAL